MFDGDFPSGYYCTSTLFAPTTSSLTRKCSPTALAPGPAAAAKSKTSIIIAQRAKTPPRNAVLDTIRTASAAAGRLALGPGNRRLVLGAAAAQGQSLQMDTPQ
jgi:hypothetical protein